MTKVLLLNPPSELLIYKEDRCQNVVNEHVQNVIRPPISLMTLAAISEQLRFQTKIMDAPIEKIDIKQFKKFLYNWKPDWVVSNTSFATQETDLLALKIVKKYGGKTVVFGYTATVIDKEIMERAKYIDFSIRGEPEKTFQELLEGVLPLENIKGLTFWKGNQIQKNEDREFIQNLDELPITAHHLIKTDLYRVPTTGEKFTTIQTARGCPYHCTFCLSTLLNGPKVRMRSAKSILKEIQFVITRLHIRNFFFRADTFTFDRQWVLQICQAIIKSNLKISWFCNSRVDTIDLELLLIMKRAGCTLITFGIESGNTKVLKSIKKGITKDQAKSAILLTKNVGILTGAFYIIGLPGSKDVQSRF